MPIPTGNARDSALAQTIVAWKMPDMDVTERTDATRRIGASIMLEELMGGDVRMDTQYGREILGEVLGRIVANAEQNGIVIQFDRSAPAE